MALQRRPCGSSLWLLLLAALWRSCSGDGAASASGVAVALDSEILASTVGLSMRHVAGRLGVRPTFGSHAIVTHFCSDDWLPGAVALAASLRSLNTQADLVLVVHHDVSQSHYITLGAIFDSVVKADPISPHPSIVRPGADCLTLQLLAWQLPHHKVLYMDSDMIALGPVDHIFEEHDELSARMDHVGFGFNGGMFLCKPSADTFGRLAGALRSQNVHSSLGGMQAFLNSAFPTCKSGAPSHGSANLPVGCLNSTLAQPHNVFSRDLNPHEVALLHAEPGIGPVETLHYTGDWAHEAKPWMRGCMAPADSVTRKGDRVHEQLMDLWIRAYNSSAQWLHTVPSLECPLFHCATPSPVGKMDFVILADDTRDCVLTEAVRSLQSFAAPRHIVLVTSQKPCSTLHQELLKHNASSDAVLRCVAAEDLVQGLALSGVEAWFRQEFQQEQAKLANKYWQRLLRMGLAHAALPEELRGLEAVLPKELSEHFVLWDSASVMLRPFCPITADGQVSNMVGDVSKEDDCTRSQAASYELLTGTAYEPKATGKKHGAHSHHSIVSRQGLRDLLERARSRRAAGLLQHGGSAQNKTVPSGSIRGRGPPAAASPTIPPLPDWSLAILEASCPTVEACQCGFSEHLALASWMRHAHPELVKDLPPQFGEFFPGRRPALLARDWVKDPWWETKCPSSHNLACFLLDGHQFARIVE